jgi:hypothetical protein
MIDSKKSVVNVLGIFQKIFFIDCVKFPCKHVQLRTAG